MSGIFSSTRLIRDPVATSAALPIGSDVVGAIRVVLSDYSVWVYTGTAWQQAGGGSVPLSPLDNSTIYLNGSSKVAIKPLGITDGLISSLSTIVKVWSNSVTYDIGAVVVYNNGLYMNRVANNINFTPSFTTNNWINIANYPEYNKYLGYAEVTGNYTQSRGDCRFVIPPITSDITITMLPITTLDTSSNLNHIMKFSFFKLGQTNKVTVSLSGTDKFSDGSTSFDIPALGTEREITAILKSPYAVWIK